MILIALTEVTVINNCDSIISMNINGARIEFDASLMKDIIGALK